MADDWSQFSEAPKSADDWSQFSDDAAPPDKPITSKIREYTDPTPFLKGAAKGVAGMGVGVGQRLSNIPGTEGIAQSAPAQAIKNWALAPNESWKETAGEIAGPGVITAPIGGALARGAAKLAPYVPSALSGLAAQWPRLSSALGGAATGGATAAATTPTESGNVSIPATMLGAGLGGGLSAIGRSPTSRQMQQMGIRQTPGQTIPGIGPVVERAASHVPGARAAVGQGLKTMRDDAQRAGYNYAYESVGMRANPSHPVGDDGLDRVQANIGGVYDRIAAQGTLPSTGQLYSDLRAVAQKHASSLTNAQRDHLQRIIDNEVISRFAGTSGIIPGTQIVGSTGIRSNLSDISRTLAKNDLALARAVRDVRKTVTDNISFANPQNKQALLNADEAYARYEDLERAAQGDRAGFFGPSRILQRPRRGGQRAHPDLRQLAKTMRAGGVPDIYKGGAVLPRSWLHDALGVGSSLGIPYYAWHDPATAAKLAAGVGVPMWLLNSPAGMSALSWLAQQSPAAIGTVAGTAAGQAQPRRRQE